MLLAAEEPARQLYMRFCWRESKKTLKYGPQVCTAIPRNPNTAKLILLGFICDAELNNESYQSASSNLERNQLFPPTVKLVKVSEDTPLLEVVAELNLEQE
jgi:hypothetical protein